MRSLRRWWGVLPAVLLVTLIWPERGFVAIWDGNVYLRCVVDAASNGFDLQSLRCGGHHSQLYMGLLALAHMARPGSVAAVLIANILLGGVSLWALSVLLCRLLPGEEWWPERALLVCCVAVHPLVNATLVQVNADFGVYAFFLPALALLAERRYWGAALAGLFLCFSKETGVLMYSAALAVHAGFRFGASDGPAAQRVRTISLDIAPAVAPLLVYASFLGWWASTQPSLAVWNRGMHERPLAGIRLLDFDDPVLRSYAAVIFVLGFMWLPTAAIVADVVVGASRTLRRLPDRPVVGVTGAVAGMLGLLTALLVYLLTLYRTYSNPRYFVVLAPLVLVMALVSLVRLGTGARVRRGALAAMALLLYSANHYSWDPGSRLAFGTFSSGDRDMYRMTSISGELRGPGRDQLCYNLQFTGFDAALGAAFSAIHPGDSTVVVFSRFNTWGLWTPLDRRTFARSAARSGTVTPRYSDETMVAAARERRPAELWLVEMPNDVDKLARQSLRNGYAETDSARFAPRGVAVVVRHLVSRGTEAAPPESR